MQSNQGRPLLIALVDDDEFVRRGLARLLRAAGHAVQTYSSGAEFLQASQSVHPACVVLDLHMPQVSGYEVLKALRDRSVSVPVVVVTADTDPQTPARTIALGAAACLAKPVEGAVLLDAIAAAVESFGK